MMIREAYFVEHKEYLTSNSLGLKIHKVSGVYASHFKDRTSPSFEKFIIFQIELWCKRNLPTHFGEIQQKIDNWRVKNNDNSVYANQVTPLRKIAYQILLLHYQEKDEILNIGDLDRMLQSQIPSLKEDFFKRRIKPSTFDRSVSKDAMLLIKDFVCRNYDMRKKEVKLLRNNIEAFIETIPDSGILKSHSSKFRDLYIFQTKQLIDITKGLDPLYCTFSFEEDLRSLTRQHTEEDPEYPFILFEFKDGSYVFKLVPLGFHTSHIDIHQNDGLSMLANEIVKARMEHLFELSLMEYDDSISEEEYIKIFKGFFSSRRDHISSLNSEENIWGEFGYGKVRSITDDTIVEFVERWIASKEMSEQSWYNGYYKTFYRQKFMRWIKDIYNYMRDRSNVWVRSEMCEWFINTYLRDEALFYHKSLDSFINNI